MSTDFEVQHPRTPAGAPGAGKFRDKDHAEGDIDLAVIDAVETDSQRDWGTAAVSWGSSTPWGTADDVEPVAPGIARVGTPSHGGAKLSAQRNRAVPAPLRSRGGWYEEDIDESVAMWAFHSEYAALWGKDPADVRDEAARVLREWRPHDWEAATGETVDPSQSHVLREESFEREHACDWRVRSAEGTSDGHVAVWADLDGQARRFLVSKEAYAAAPREGSRIALTDLGGARDITPAPEPEPERHHDTTLSGLTPAQTARAERDLAQRWRDPDGGARRLRDIIDQDGMVGKHRQVDDGTGRVGYYLEGRSSSAYPISAAGWKGLGGIPDLDGPDKDAELAYRKASAEFERLRARSAMFDDLREARRKCDEAERVWQAAREEARR